MHFLKQYHNYTKLYKSLIGTRISIISLFVYSQVRCKQRSYHIQFWRRRIPNSINCSIEIIVQLGRIIDVGMWLRNNCQTSFNNLRRAYFLKVRKNPPFLNKHTKHRLPPPHCFVDFLAWIRLCRNFQGVTV